MKAVWISLLILFSFVFASLAIVKINAATESLIAGDCKNFGAFEVGGDIYDCKLREAE